MLGLNENQLQNGVRNSVHIYIYTLVYNDLDIRIHFFSV